MVRKEDFDHVMILCEQIEDLETCDHVDIFWTLFVSSEEGCPVKWGELELWRSGRASFTGTSRFYTSKDRKKFIADLKASGLINL